MGRTTVAGIGLAAVLAGSAVGACQAPGDSPTESADAQATDQPVTIGFRRIVPSAILGEERAIRVFLPDGYEADSKSDFGLLVLSDGPWDFRVAASLVNSLSYVGAIPRLVVIGIPNPNRGRDLTPVVDSQIEGSGGGAQYLQSLASEVLPYVDRNWPTNGFRVFSGHSLGGLTALNILVEQPDLFDAYLALSPSLEVGNGVMYDHLIAFLDSRDDLNKMVYVAVGDEHQERGYFDRFVTYLRGNSPDGLRWGSELFDHQDDHNSMRVTGFLSGLRWVFADWQLRSPRVFRMGLEALDEHYALMSAVYKQPRAASVDEVAAAVLWGLHDPDLARRSADLAREAVGRWPNHPASHAALGEALALTGNVGSARQSMEEAIRLAETSGSDHVDFYRASLQRIAGSTP